MLCLIALPVLAAAANYRHPHLLWIDQPVNKTAVYENQSTALTLSPTSDVKGKAFDRYISIWLENTNYESAISESTFTIRPYCLASIRSIATDTFPGNMKKLSEQGVLLEEYRAVTHPSQPNYLAAISGSDWDVDESYAYSIPERNIVDFLEEKDVSWSTYQENLPFSGYLGKKWPDDGPMTERYYRKHK